MNKHCEEQLPSSKRLQLEDDAWMSSADPVAVLPHETLCGEVGLFACRTFEVGATILEEDPVLLIPSGPCQILSAAIIFLELPLDVQRAVLKLRASSKLLVDALDPLRTVASPFAPHEFTRNRLEGSARSLATVLAKQKAVALGNPCEADDSCDQSSASGVVPPGREGDIWRLVHVLQANSFHTAKGTALFLQLSRANHSCAPNATLAELPQGGYAIIAVTPLQKYDEITINYGSDEELLLPTSIRQKWFVTCWGHSCQCPRCGAAEEAMRAFRCVRCECNGARQVSFDPLGNFEHMCVCSICQDGSTAEELFIAEEVIVAKYWQLQKKTNASDTIAEAIHLQRQAAQLLADSHWVNARLHDLLGKRLTAHCNDFCTVIRHRVANLIFWDLHLQRPSARRSWLFEELGDALSERYFAQEAQHVFKRALVELTYVQPIGSEHCATLRKKLSCTMAAANEVDCANNALPPEVNELLKWPRWLMILESSRTSLKHAHEPQEGRQKRQRQTRWEF